MHLVKLKPKRRCRIPRRPHPNLDCIFGRFERTETNWTNPELTSPTSSRSTHNLDTDILLWTDR